MEDFMELMHNPIFVSAAAGWCAAQFLKVVIHTLLNHKFDPERIFGAGGMPSSHSSTVCALVISTAMVYGFRGFAFPMAFFFAFIVMYDARGVRLQTGKQAEVINEMQRNLAHISEALAGESNAYVIEDELKELIGHTPLQVLCGAILGLIVGYLTCGLVV